MATIVNDRVDDPSEANVRYYVGIVTDTIHSP